MLFITLEIIKVLVSVYESIWLLSIWTLEDQSKHISAGHLTASYDQSLSLLLVSLLAGKLLLLKISGMEG